MTERRSFYRKVVFLALIAVLLIVKSLFSQPASVDADGVRSPGGKLAQLRDEYHLSQASLGEIDPTSETMKLATLGMRGIAVQLLWNSAHEYQKNEDWTSCKAVVNQIIRLQPNFFTVWDFLGHDIAYNISVEFDDYRDRFYWVINGIEFLKQGAQLNNTDPRFPARIGWIYSNKLGRADEHVEYRQLFKKMQEDKGEKHTDNWLVGYDWFIEAQKLVDSGSKNLRIILGGPDARLAKPGEKAPSPVLFHSEPPMALINYADTLEEEGTFGETAKAQWQNAAHEWQSYSYRDLPTSYGYTVRLIDLELCKQQIKNLQDQIDKLVPGEYQKIKEEKLAKLTPDERAAHDKSRDKRTPEENKLAGEAGGKLIVTWDEVALRAAPEHRVEARKLIDDLADVTQKMNTIDTYRDIVNYNYWLSRCQAEPTDAMLAARESLYKADKAYENGELFDAKDLYEKAFDQWHVALAQFPVLHDSTIMSDELGDDIDQYKKLLGKIGKKFPEKFALQDILDERDGKLPPPNPSAPDEGPPAKTETKSSTKADSKPAAADQPKSDSKKADSKAKADAKAEGKK